MKNVTKFIKGFFSFPKYVYDSGCCYGDTHKLTIVIEEFMEYSDKATDYGKVCGIIFWCIGVPVMLFSIGKTIVKKLIYLLKR